MANFPRDPSLHTIFSNFERRIAALERGTVSSPAPPSEGGGVTVYTELIGNGTDMYYLVEHGLGTKSVIVQVFRNSAPYDEIIVDKERTTNDVVTINFNRVVTANEFVVVIMGE